MKSRGFGRLASVWALFLVLSLLVGCGGKTESKRSSSAASSKSSTVVIPPKSASSATTEEEAPEEEAEEAEEETEAEEAETEEAPEGPVFAGFPEVGETVEGFTLLEVRDFEILGAEVGWFVHDETDAKLMYIHNDDTNRAFDLTFLTHAINNEGLPHVFEHATLGGSKNYPSRTLFMNLIYQSYNTFMNAMTTDRMTTYPVASLSEKQLLALADYYTDSCFYPMIMEDESIYRTEAWRYRLEDPEGELTMEGTVYSEMQGAMTKDMWANLNAVRASLPGSSICYAFGGDPAYIPDMTWQDLKDYHDRFYTPENCVAYLYGDIAEYEAFLKMLDNVFTNFGKEDAADAEEEADAEEDADAADEASTEDSADAASTEDADAADEASTEDAADEASTEDADAADEASTEDAADEADEASTEEEAAEEEAEPWFVEEDYEPITESKVEEFAFAAEESAATENASIVYYNFVGSAFTDEDAQPLQMLAILMGAEASPLTQTLKKEFPAGTAGAGVEIAGPELLPMFYIQNVNREDAEKYQEIVREALEDVKENGFPEELIDGVMATQSLNNRLVRESNEANVNVIYSFAYAYAVTGDPWNLMAQYDAADSLMEWNKDGTFSALAETLLDEEQTLTTLVTTYPEPGLKEKEDAALAEELAKIKAGMSDEEIEAIIAASGVTEAAEEEAAEEESEEETEDAADEATTDAADEATTDAADEATTDAADEATTDAADEATTDAADEATTDAADEATTDAADEATTDAADEATTDAADEATTDASDDASTGVTEEEAAEEGTEEETEEEAAEDGMDDVTAALIAKLKVVGVSDLPEEVRRYEIRDEKAEEEEVRYLDAVAGVDGVGMVNLLIDAQSFGTEELHDLMLFRHLTEHLETKELSRAEIDTKLTRYTYNPQIALSTIRTEEGGAHPYLAISWIAAEEDLEEGYDLMRQIVFELKLDDTQKLADSVQAVYTQMRNEYNEAPYLTQLFRGFATYDEQRRFLDYLSGPAYYAYLAELQEMFAEEDEEATQAFVERMKGVQEKLRNRYGAIVLFAGNETDITANRELADLFLQNLEYEETEAAVYDLPSPATKEAFIAESSVQYNSMVAGYEDLGLEDGYSADLMVLGQIVTDQILLPEIRDGYGAYGAFSSFLENEGAYLYTYRDPNVKESFDVYATIAEKLREMELDQETIDGYIMSTYVSYAMPQGELTGAMTSLNNVLLGISPEDTLEDMRSVKSVTPERIRELADLYDKIVEAGRVGTSGSAAKINDNEELFEEILNPFGASTEETEVNTEFTDVPEDHEFYEAVQTVVGMGLMEPLEEDAFGVDEASTIGEFAYILMGGMMDAESALSTLQQAGLLKGKAEDPLKKETVIDTMETVLSMQQVTEEIEWDKYPLSETVTRGELAYLVVAE
ncbi:MAG: insulinase family protein [Lachnospiraceae bacterium]|nr:insulinase family protein [Lachnospiraceae bacterium]